MRQPTPNARFEPSSPDTRRESTERRILESAVALIDSGVTWHQLGIRQIAERADISRTAFYDFFGSKNEVLEHLVTGLHDDLAHLVAESGPDDEALSTDLRELRAFHEVIAAYAATHGRVYRAFLDASGEDPRLDRLWDRLMELYRQILERSIARARSDVPTAPVTPDARFLAEILLMSTERTMTLLIRDPEMAHRAQLLNALSDVWERAVFGRLLAD